MFGNVKNMVTLLLVKIIFNKLIKKYLQRLKLNLYDPGSIDLLQEKRISSLPSRKVKNVRQSQRIHLSSKFGKHQFEYWY